MKRFNNLKVAYKVMISCAILILLLIAAVFFSITAMRSVKSNVTDYRMNSVLAVIKMDSIAKNILQGRLDAFYMEKALARGDKDEVARRLEGIQKIRTENLELLNFIKERSMTEEEKQLTEQYEADYLLMGAKMKEYMTALNSGSNVDATLEAWTVQFDVVLQKLKELQALTLKYGAEKIVTEFSRMDRTIIIMLIILLFSISAGVLITYILSRAVSIPVKLGLSFAQKIADGDLTERIDLDQEDELGQLAKSLNKAADNLEKLVSNVNMSVNNLTMAVTDISSGNQNLSQRTTEQASSLEEIASTLEEATATIRQTADNTVEANKIADSSTKLAVNGGTIVEETVGSINRISESGKKIGEIIAVINEIAFQTNLLALNAAVEAARAGDQGRGFAVVASEVRNLAQRTGSSAKEIEALIKNTLENINQGTSLVSKSGVALSELITSVKEVGRIISEVTASTEEQRQGIDQINIAVMDLDAMTQQNAALVEETASASEEMAAQAEELAELMKQFKINETAASGGTHRVTHDFQKTLKKENPAKKPAITAKPVIKDKPETAVKTDTKVNPETAAKQEKPVKTESKTAVKDKPFPKTDKDIKKHLEDEGFEAF
ncbi:MAG TPA: methyl-accepting chemotaxis protein [Spirochaetota bacterium]|nr:methyl-accepting chemotaxis protein [Spirochaetota bacterium]